MEGAAKRMVGGGREECCVCLATGGKQINNICQTTGFRRIPFL
jgi:hypothetical protein